MAQSWRATVLFCAPRNTGDARSACLVYLAVGCGRIRGPRCRELPSGTVTFLFTDVEGSTRLWEEHPDAMPTRWPVTTSIVRDVIEAHGGYLVKTTGDGFHATFATADDAVDAAIAAQ